MAPAYNIGSLLNNVPKLTGHGNYGKWAWQLRMVLTTVKYWDVISGVWPVGTPEKLLTDPQLKLVAEYNSIASDAFPIISLSIDTTQLPTSAVARMELKHGML